MSGRRPRPERRDARAEAFDILLRVERAGAWAGVLLDQREALMTDPRDAALLHETVLGVLRRRAVLDHAIGTVARRPIEAIDLPVRVALRIGAYALLVLERVPDYAAVDGAVDLVKRAGSRSSASFVNAVLRAIARDGAALLPGPSAPLALRHSHPSWWVRRLVDRFGSPAAEAILESDNRPAETVLRARLGRTTSVDLAARLAADGVQTTPGRFAPGALRVVSGAPIRTAAFRDGLFWIQDEASILAALLAGGEIGPRVLDACAAPGGKSMVLAESLRPGGLVVAADRHPGRLKRLAANLKRLGFDDVVPVAADMTRGGALRGPFDVVLVDAPCSGTGTLRRHPEIRWRLTLDEIPRLAARQLRILEAAASLVGPGGRLVYAVCSIEPEEGEDVVTAFLAGHRDFRIGDPTADVPEPARRLVDRNGMLHTTPADAGLDGFFGARLDRVGP